MQGNSLCTPLKAVTTRFRADMLNGVTMAELNISARQGATRIEDIVSQYVLGAVSVNRSGVVSANATPYSLAASTANAGGKKLNLPYTGQAFLLRVPVSSLNSTGLQKWYSTPCQR
jgi:hypothetical protein